MFSNLSDQEKGLLLCLPVVVWLVGMMVWNSWKVSGEQYDKAIERCATKERPAACVVAVQEHHDECLDKALTRGGRFDGEHFNVRVYDDCVLGVGQDEDDPASSVE